MPPRSASLHSPSANTSSKTSSIAQKNYRSGVLRLANISFHEANLQTPASVTEFIELLSFWPIWYNGVHQRTILEELNGTSESEKQELQSAIDFAQPLRPHVFEVCKGSTEASWIGDVSYVVLRVFRDNLRGFTKSDNETWSEGSNPAGLHNPRPDMAFGLGFEQSGALSRDVLDALSFSPITRLVYSPVDNKGDFRLMFPSLLYEAKSDKRILEEAEDQVAVSASRALTLLAELSETSGVPHQHCVVALASAGATWSLHVAYQDLSVDKKMHMVPVLERPLFIRSFNDRIRLMLMLNRLERWMLGPYRNKVAEQVEALWRYSQQSSSTSAQEEMH